MRETPLPGAYPASTLVEALEKRPNSFSFGSVGRRVETQRSGRGEMLLPGAYEFQDAAHALDKQVKTYSFKSISREGGHGKDYYLNWGLKDKDVNVAPNKYKSEQLDAINAPKVPVKHAAFKSQIKRFPTKYFKPREGPSPGAYHEEKHPLEKVGIVKSVFQSKTPRFLSSHTRTPGPGTYTASLQSPMPRAIANVGKHYGIFFKSDFEA